MPKFPVPTMDTVEQFKKKGGYELVDKYTWDKVEITALAKTTELSRGVIYAIKEHYPIDPEKYKYDYEVDFEKSEGWKLVQTKLQDTPLERYLKDVKRVMLKAYHYLGKKEPLGWKVEQIDEVRKKCVDLRDPETNDIRTVDRTNLIRGVEAMGKYELRAPLLKVPKREPKKIEWYLEEPDYVRYIYGIQECDTLIYFMLGSLGGARHSGITDPHTVPEGINFERQRMTFYEVKVKRKKAYVTKALPQRLLKLVLRYVADFKVPSNRNFFKWSYATFNGRLKKVGDLLRLPKKTTTHIMKHTFVSLGSFHGLSPDILEKQTGTEWETLKKFYRAEDEKRMDKEILGVEYPIETWNSFVNRMMEHFEKRYDELLVKYPIVDGRRIEITLKPAKPPKPEKPPRKKRLLTVTQMKALVESPKTPEKLKAWAKKWLKEHGKN